MNNYIKMNIKEYNLVLANHECAYTLWTYLHIILPKYFPEYKIHILLRLITMNYKEYDIFIQYEFIKQFNLKKKPNTYIKKYKFTNNIDFKILDNKYKFTPNAFKKILIGEPNNIYKEYLILIDKCMFYYMEYQNNAQKKINLLINQITKY